MMKKYEHKQEHTDCLIEIIKKAKVSTIQSCVRLNDIRQLGYIYSTIIEQTFNVKRGTGDFGIVLSIIFEPYECLNRIRMEELQHQLRHHYTRYKHCYSPDLKQFHKEEYNKLVEEERELYKPIKKFVRLANKIKKEQKNDKTK